MKGNKILGWEIKDIKVLVNMAEGKGENSLLEVFNEYGKLTNRKPFSVRNFYYKLCNLYENDDKIREILNKNGIEINTTSFHFSNMETEKLLIALLDNRDHKSVRQKCLDLANGDMKLMIRYQNKYRNTLKNAPELVERVQKLLEKRNIATRAIKRNNISMMPIQHQKGVSNKDIEALFWGLVRLVKKSAEENIETTLKREAEFANTALQNSLIDLRRKEVLIAELREQNAELKNKLKRIEDTFARSQEKMIGHIATISSLANGSKLDELKNFLKTLGMAEKFVNN